MLLVIVQGVRVWALIDTGATISVMRADLCSRLRKVKTPYLGSSLIGANGAIIRPLAQCTARVFIDGIRHHITFAVLISCAHELILGWDFLSSASALISCRQRVLQMTETDHCSERIDETRLRFSTAADSVLPPGQEQLIPITSTHIANGDVFITPYGRCLARGIVFPSSLVRFKESAAVIVGLNTTTETILLPQGSAVTCYVDTQPASFVPLDALQAHPPQDKPISSSTFASGINPDLPAPQREALLKLLAKHQASFDANASSLGQTTVASHRINTDGQNIVRRRPYRVSLAERKIIEENVADMLKRNIIRPSASSWSSPVVLVQKKDGSVRFCVDYRALNKITRKDVYPMPRIDDALDSLQGAQYFSTLDLRSGYWQIPMDEADKEKTAFSTPDGLYEFNVMPFGLCNAPATFERMIDTVLRGLKWKTCLCYLDDIVVFSSTFDDHLQRLDEVLTCLSNAGLQLNTKKCHFGSTTIKVLGHLVNKDGIQPDPDKISAVLNFPRPLRAKELRSFLGLASYFRRFIRNFATIASPLHKLLASTAPFDWNHQCEAAFQELKRALTSPPVLCYFNDEAPTVLHTDASGQGIGAVLLQRDREFREKVVAYASRTLTSAEKKYSITEQECLAVVWSIQKFRPYLHGRHFTVVTDHHALCWLSTIKNLSGRLGRWIIRLQAYDFDVIYKTGKKHQDADALSRCPLPPTSEHVTSPCQIGRTEDTSSIASISSLPSANRPSVLSTHQRADSYCSDIISRLSGASSSPNARLRKQLKLFKFEDDVLYRYIFHPEGHRWVPVVPRALRGEVLRASHDDPTSGHFGYHKTHERIRSRFFWPGLSTSVAKYIASCALCQHRKRPTTVPVGTLQPLPCPAQPFSVVGIDLFGPLPTTPDGKRWIVTAVDHLTRYAETASITSGTASEVATFFLKAIYLRHGAPHVLLSDRGKAFLSSTLSEVLQASNTIHKTTSSYHPQTNGLTERFHRTLCDMLSMYIQPDHRNWDAVLPFVTFAYNTSVQRTTGYSPFFLVYGRQPTSSLDVSFFSGPVNSSPFICDQFLYRVAQCRRRARINTEASQEDRKNRYDATHRDVFYRPGDAVLLWTPARTPGLCEKLESRYIGPYTVIDQTSPVNYRVTPVHASTDQRCRGTEVVHVSRLKPFHLRSTT